MNVVEQYNLTLQIEVLKEQSAETLARLCNFGDVEHNVKAGETLIMPSEVPHSLNARENFKMLLTVVK